MEDKEEKGRHKTEEQIENEKERNKIKYRKNKTTKIQVRSQEIYGVTVLEC
jgi:hypothetical protein